jgi:hypothetical protein
VGMCCHVAHMTRPYTPMKASPHGKLCKTFANLKLSSRSSIEGHRVLEVL